MILTVDLGTTVTKAVVWGDQGPVGVGRAEVRSSHPQPGWVEQQPADWWQALVDAVAQAVGAPGAPGRVAAIAFSAARETFVPVAADGEPLGSALVWSDRRAVDEAAELGVDVGASSAKARWLERHDAGRLSDARWLLSPRDWIVLRLTGVAVTDRTLASRTGWYSVDGEMRPDAPRHLLPRVVPSTTIVGEVSAPVAEEIGVPAGVPVVLGGGDRACEVLGTGATPDRPMVSWGTTANLSAPTDLTSSPVPGPSISAGALDGFLLEFGLSAAGAAVEWLAHLSGRTTDELRTLATGVPPGSGGVIALPWFNGARAPWWEPRGRAGFVGLTPAAGAAELARAIYEGVAFDIARCTELVAGSTGTSLTALCGAGGGAASDLWPSILAAASERPVERRVHADLAASAGARLIVAAALGEQVALDEINPLLDVVEPHPAWVDAYRSLRVAADRAAAAVLAT